MAQLSVNTPFRTVIKDIAIYFPGKLLPALSALITIPIYARIFRPEQYGLLALINMVIGAGTITFAVWLTSSVIRFYAVYRKENQLDVFYSTLLLAVCLSLGCLIFLSIPIYFATKHSWNPEISRLLPLSAIIVVINSIFVILQTVLRASENARLFVASELWQVYIGLLVGLTLVIVSGLGVEGILFGFLFAVTTSCIGIVYWLVRSGMRIRRKSVSFMTLKEFAAYGLPGGIATVGTWVLTLSDRYLIEYFRGTTEVGLYTMGYTIADRSISLVVSSLMLAVGPILINTWETKGSAITVHLLRQVTRLTLILVLPMVVGLSILAYPVFRVLTTEAYFPGAPVLPWVSAGAFLYGLSLQAYTGLVLSKKTRTMAINYILAAFINVVLNLLFVPKFGFSAAAVNKAVAYGALLLFNIYCSNEYLRWEFPWVTFRNAAFAAAVMALPIFGGKMALEASFFTLGLMVMFGAGVYSCVLILTREISKKELTTMMSYVKGAVSYSLFRIGLRHRQS